ncbi:MAG: alpha-E domain-containing protein [Bacteroidota bacterium]
MLSRVANSLYWVGRYIERSENLARYLRVQYFSILDAPMSQNKDFILKSILTMYGMEFDQEELVNEQEVLVEVGLNAENPISLLSTVFAARENARSVRYIISSELWEVINQYYLFVKEYDKSFFKTRGLFDFTFTATKHCSIVRSYLDHTLLHDDIWVFIELGIYLERAAQIVRILRSKLHDIAVLTEDGGNIPLLRYQWTITLKVLEAFDVHRRIYKKPQTQHTVIEFLTSNAQFPRSVAYNLKKVHELVSQLNQSTKSGEQLLFKAGKLSSHFQYLEYGEVKDELLTFLDKSLSRIYELNVMIEEEYFNSIS